MAATDPGPCLRVTCAWCGRERDGKRWRAAPTGVNLREFTHGICPACRKRELQCCDPPPPRARPVLE